MMAAVRVGGIFKDFLVSDETRNEGGFTGWGLRSNFSLSSSRFPYWAENVLYLFSGVILDADFHTFIFIVYFQDRW